MDMDLFLLNKLDQIKNGGGGTTPIGGAVSRMLSTDDSVTPTDVQKPIATVFSTYNRASTVSDTWSNTNATDSLYTYAGGGNHWQHFWLPLGYNSHFDSSTQNYETQYNDKMDYADHDAGCHGLVFADRGVSGVMQMGTVQNYNSSYNAFGSRIMFLKNTTTSSITRNLYFFYSSYWSSGYDGAGVRVFTPNSANFDAVTSVTETNAWSYTSNTWLGSTSCSITIPAQTTIAVVLSNTFNNWTSVNNQQWIYGHNGFQNLDSTVYGGIECDLKATEVYLSTANYDYTRSTSTAEERNNIVKFFNHLGRVYGNYNTEVA